MMEPRRPWWMREALAHDAGEVCPPVTRNLDADVLIMGGGYTGLWTAFFLTERAPGIDVVLLEQDICGGGPSGRNGGFVTAWWDELPDLVEMFGPEAALDLCGALGASVRSIGTWCVDHGVDAWFAAGGYLQVATCQAQDRSWSRAVDLARALGVSDEYVDLDASDVALRCRSPVFRSGVLMRDGATVQPARLARGLRRVLLERGVRIHERTPVRRFRAGDVPAAETSGGAIRSGQMVLALGAWTAALRHFRRRAVTWGSHIVLTEPAPDRLAEIGWTGGECITDSRTAVHYFRTTPDGRLAFGGGGGRAFRRIGPQLSEDPTSIRRAEEGLRRMFPSFADIPVEDAWGGPIDVSPTHLPFFGSLPGGRVHVGLGYTGNGVAPSHLGGRILAARALGIEDELTSLPIVDSPPVRFPPEPLRSVGARVIREAVVAHERAEERGGRAPWPVRFLARLPRKLGYRIGPE